MKRLVLALMALATLAQGAFVSPNEGPVPFRRDKLPIDVETMTSLSRQLVVLASTPNPGGPADLRRTAQIIAVSLALDPTNRAGHELAKRMVGGGGPDDAGQEALGRARSRVRHLHGWLELPEAGKDGNALAACLADILEGADPGHPGADGRAEDLGKWDGWVAPAEAFRDAPPVVAGAEVDPPADKRPEPEAGIRLAKASVTIPMWTEDQTTKLLVLKRAVVSVDARKEDANPALRIVWPGGRKPALEQKAAALIGGVLGSRHGALPKGVILSYSIAGGLPYSRAENGDVLQGAMLVLADAVVSGVPPQATVFAEPGEGASVKPPARFWRTLRALAETDGATRLVMPAQVGELLPYLITLDRSGFFFSHEVLLAADAGALCELASSVPPESVAGAHDEFVTVLNARGNRTLGSFLNHDSTQRRLASVVDGFGGHASARMLALRGTPQWPKRLPRKVYAREVRGAVELMEREFKQGGWAQARASTMSASAERCRQRLGEIEKLFSSVGDRQEFHAPAMNLSKSVEKLAAAAKRGDSLGEARIENEQAYRETWREYVGLVGILTEAVGDAADYPAPKADRIR